MTRKTTSPGKTLLIGLLALITQGCANVLIGEPIGTEPATLVADEWNGTWFNPGGTLTVEVIDAEHGEIDIAWIEAKDGALKMESHRLVLKSAGDWIFGSMKTNEEKPSEGWLWGRIKKDERQIVFWLPRLKPFEQWVNDGKLPGQIKGDNVILGKLEPEHLALLSGEQAGILYHWDEPMVLMRLGR